MTVAREPSGVPAPSGLAEAVLRRARRSPKATAVVDGDRVLDYATLDSLSTAVAGALRAHGVRPGQAVAVCLPRSWELVCVMLGILRAKAVVVPLDAQSPPERQHHILRDSGSVALVHDGTAGHEPLPGVQPLPAAALLAGSPPAGAPDPVTDAPPGTRPDPRPETGVSFLYYTSGTTGRPKGVEVRDSGILRLARPGWIRMREGDRYACLSNPAFDALSFEVWAPLLTGGCCVVLDDEEVNTPHLLAAALLRERIDTLFITVTLFNAVVDAVPHCFAGAGQVLIGGEALSAPLVRRWYRDNTAAATRLINAYGPTESATFALSHTVPRDFDADAVPIGRPLPGTDVLLAVDGTRPAGPGEVAELHLAGDGLAAGYRNLPEETARRFVRLPWHDGGRTRWYRTGDLVRRDDTGRIRYVGRADRQVKVRGFRIEPGEVERCLLAHRAVRQAHVCARRNASGANDLLAYLALRGELSYEELEGHLTASLPRYMRPHRIHLVDAFPRNANGKVDEAALVQSGGEPFRRSTADGAAPADGTAEERAVLELAGRVLGVTDLRPEDRWIPSGGDSLKAMRLRFEIHRRFGCELPQTLVLRADFAELAAAVVAGRVTGDSHRPPPPSPAGARSAPATSEQQRLWLMQQRDPKSRAYDVPLVFEVRGPVDLAALRTAVRSLVARHPALRTAFRSTPEGLRQEVAEPYDPWITAPDRHRPPAEELGTADQEELRGEDGAALARRVFATPFDLADPRMLQVCWLPRDGGGTLVLHAHHIAVDGWSLGILFRDLSGFYRAALNGEPPAHGAGAEEVVVTPLDFARWQEQWFAAPAYRAQCEGLQAVYDREEEEVCCGDTPAEPFRSQVRTPAGLLRTSLDLVRRTALDRLGAELGLTRFQLLLSVFAWSLYGVTGRRRPVIATPVANRPVHAFEAGVGMFANTVLVPLRPVPHEDLRTQLTRQGAAVRAVLEYGEVALADVLAGRRLRTEGEPFDAMFVLENTEFDALTLPGCDVSPVWPRPVEAKSPLTLSVIEHEDGFDCLWEYADGHLDAADAEAAARLFEQALDRLGDGRATTLTGLVAPHRRSLADPGHGPDTSPAFTTVAEGFARQLRRTPAAPAVSSDDRTLSYAELDAHAAALAAELKASHPLPGDDDQPRCVALHLPPSLEHVVALLALARLNLTVVPLDPAYPPSLLRQILEQCDPLCVLLAPGQEDALDRVAPDALRRHTLALAPGTPPAAADAPADSPADAPADSPADAPADSPADAPADSPAHGARRPLYTLFTSGSTGTPKGVQVPDSTLCNLLRWQSEAGGLAEPAVTQQFSMLSFDVSFQEIFTALCGGGHLRLVRPEWRQDIPELLERLDTAGVERIFLPYVALQLLAEHGDRLGVYPSRLREVITAGEQLVCNDAMRRWFGRMPGARLFNHYGPTETHVVSGLCLDGDPALWPDRPAIGRPVAGAWLRVVDDADEPVPPGCVGHLLIGGPMAAPCYLGDEELNRERFVELGGSGRFYRSGDLARFDREGLLHYAGRDDQQIKISGHRLELGQVEAALLRHPRIANAVVVQDGSVLVACVQCRGEAPDAGELDRHLEPLLPGWVRIGRYRYMTALPLTPSGKLDRRAVLRAPGEDMRVRVSRIPALSPREARLTELFEAATGKRAEPDQRFFDAGATSLDLMRFHLRCTAEPDLRFGVPELFEHVSIRRLARFLGGDTQTPKDGRAHADAERAQSATRDSPRHREAVAPTPARPAGPVAEPIAVIGMAVQLPGADDLAGFWDLVTTGGQGIERFEAPEGLVGARSQMSGLLAFDPGHFGISLAEARQMDPQQRHLLMNCVRALAHAGIARPSPSPNPSPSPYPGTGTGTGTGTSPRAGQRIGVVAACGENTYFQDMLREGDPAHFPDRFQMALHHDKDFLTTKVAYQLGLTGPAFTVQAACASSLVAVHVAAGLLGQGDAEVMLAGGVLVDTRLSDGYEYQPQHIFSPDGDCRPFSDDAAGTIGASGVATVVLKPLRLARRDGDTVYAVVTGSALNNDGSEKLSYSAPSLAGQREVIRSALRRSGRDSADLGYVEAHGTGTRLGDPVEVGALRQAFGLEKSQHCALASVKSQIGHLGAAAGVAGLVRAALAVHHGVIPPNVGFRRINPQIGDDPTPFYIPEKAQMWPADRPRVAAVSSFGIGGTNAHLVLEAPPRPAPGGPDEHVTAPTPAPCLVLSATSAAALRADAAHLADYLAAHPDSYRQVLRHLQAGRPARRWRTAAVCPDAATAVAWLRSVADGQQDDGSAGVSPAPRPAPDVPSAAVGDGHALLAEDHTAGELVGVWMSGQGVQWPDGPAQPPWDLPPPAFDLADHDFPRAAPGAALTSLARPGAGEEERTAPARLPEAEWLHQPEWVRTHRAVTGPASGTGRVLVVLTRTVTEPETWQAFTSTHTRVVRVSAAGAYARRADDLYEVDPADPDALRLLLADLRTEAPGGVDWLHALPLAVRGPVDERSFEQARLACLDAPAALLKALSETPGSAPLRVWWLSHGAQPVRGPVERPELGLLGGADEVARQETGVDSQWVDLPSPAPAEWASLLATVVAGAATGTPPPRRLALRQGYWWQPTVQPLAVAAALPPEPALPSRAVHVVLGGTGGIGSAIAAWLLEHTDGEAVLVSRRSRLPDALRPWRDRVTLVEADLATADLDTLAARFEPYSGRLAGVVHAAGTAAGGLIARRDRDTQRRNTEGKLRGALLVERLIARHRPAYAAYCSSMSALFGGVGQFDYAAANGLLDAFAHHRSDPTEDTVRLGIGWDIWQETGMALETLHTDARHQAHLAVGLTVAEAQRIFARALRLQLPQILVSTTSLEAARGFYEPSRPTLGVGTEGVGTEGVGTPTAPARPQPEADPSPAVGEGADLPARTAAGPPSDDRARQLALTVCHLLGLDTLDPDASLYDLGMDSLTLLDLTAKISRLHGVELELFELSHRVSLNDILALLDERTVSGASSPEPVTLEVWQQGSGHDLLCLIHPVGGDIQSYRALVSALEPELTVCLIADPALRDPTLPAWSLPERASHYNAALEARFPHSAWRRRLAGWSFGAWVCLAMAAEAEAAGRPLDELYLLDPPPPGAGQTLSAYDQRQIEAVFAHELRNNRREDTSADFAEGEAQAYAERLAHCCRANLASMAAYEPPRLTRTPSVLWLAEQSVAGLPEPQSAQVRIRAWQASGAGPSSRLHIVDTTHYELVHPPQIKQVADAINAASRPTAQPTAQPTVRPTAQPTVRPASRGHHEPL